ncbi:hypothetical protein C6P44_002113 [Monosporozyma unispora]|nr:hypothetical protein C6P44_002113 [Kazachstania unispora]
MESPQPPAALFRRKKEYKRGISYSILLLGKTGTGKTTFANNLLESSIFPHQYQTGMIPNPQTDISGKITVTKPTKVVSFTSNNGLPSFSTEFDSARAHLEPGITITSTSVEISTSESAPTMADDDDIILLNLVNTYGIDDNLDDTLCFDEITSYLEQQFDYVLAEETRIRRNPRFEDSRVHVALYFIEPNGHGLTELDVELMKRVSRYTNVLPIISKADALTKEELNVFKKNILEDIQKYNVPIFKFEVDPDEDDYEAIEENETLAKLQPFAIICSDSKNVESGLYSRQYQWGTIEDVNNSKISDLLILKNVLFGSHLQEFKDTTQNLLYENYRAEKLSSVTVHSTTVDVNEAGEMSVADKRASAAPSLSNFASLINTGHFKSSQSLANKLVDNENPTTPKINQDSTNVNEESPIKQMSEEIKQENQNIIDSIKKEAQGSMSPDINERNQLRNISETVPYVIRHERIIAKQQKLEELEAQSAKELQKQIEELQKKAHELKIREKLLKQKSFGSINTSQASINSSSQLKKNDTYSDLASIVSGK